MTNPPNEPMPDTDAFIKQMQARHLAQSLDDFSHYYHATGELSKFARSLERRAIAAEKERDEFREFIKWLEENAVNELRIERDNQGVRLDRWKQKYISYHSWTGPTLTAAIRAARKDHD